MKKILLVGNPNVGKSALFSRLTGINVVMSNYSGTTVEYKQGKMKLDNKIARIIDVPGSYTLQPTCKAEEVACNMIKEGDLIVNVIDATNLERNLYQTLQLLEKKIPMVVALNFWNETKHKGISIDVKELEKLLGVPVVPTVALTGEGIKTLVSRIKESRISKEMKPISEEGRWVKIGSIIKKVESVKHRHHTLPTG